MQIEYRKVSSLTPYKNNARTHSDKQVQQLAAAITEFGWTNPLLIDGENIVIAGNGRLRAAIQLGMESVPVIELFGMSDAQKRAYVLADNKLAEQAGWDKELLRIELAALRDFDFDLELIGFDENEINHLLPTVISDGKTDPDDIPDPLENPVSQEGDIWLLGQHRLMCGDSTKGDDLFRLMAGKKADMIFTDPPYNVDYRGGTKEGLKIRNDNMSSEKFYTFLLDAFTAAAQVVSPGCPIYVCHSDNEGINFRKSLIDSGWLVKTCLVWVKNNLVLGRMDYHMRHEPILYGWKSGAAHKWCGGRNKNTVIEDLPGVSVATEDNNFLITMSDGINFCVLKVPAYEVVASGADDVTSVWKVDKPVKNEDHPTTKPVEIPRRAIVNSTLTDNSVLDPFIGSGSTMIACEQTGRLCNGMELDPVYCDVNIHRWQNFTGKHAVLAKTGEDYVTVRHNRIQ
ncbi:MAG: site-specific DNA-methyltransferase, partial [Desulforhopalus sp.]